MRILFVSPVRPATYGGGSIRTHAFLRALATLEHEVECAWGNASGGDPGATLSEFRTVLDLVEKDLPAPHRWRRQLPWTAQQLHDAALGEARERADVFDVAIAFGALGFSLLQGLLQGGRVKARCVWTDFTHIDTAMMLHLAGQPWRVNQLIEIGRVWRAERAAAQQSTLTTACIDADQARVRRWFGVGNTQLLENPIFDPQTPSAPLRKASGHGNDLLLTGDLAHDANVDGIQWFFDRCYPILRADGLTSRIVVAGRSPQASIHHMVRSRSDPNVALIANPSNEAMERAWSEASVSLVPLSRVSGSRIRILEALSRGVPVVSTTKGAEGLDHNNAPLIHVADSPARFAQQVERLASSPPSKAEQDSTGNWLEQHHSLAAFTSRVEQILGSATT